MGESSNLCENRLFFPLVPVNAPLGTCVSFLPMFTVLDVKTGHLYSE